MTNTLLAYDESSLDIPRKQDITTFRCCDFFAGSGLVTEGLKSRFKSVWANDICSKKQQVFEANHGSSHFVAGSIESVCGKAIPRHELSWSSFPCQDLSLAGNMDGIGGKRSGMVWEWFRVLDEMDSLPPVVVAENVVGLVSSKEGEHYVSLHNALSERGYRVGAVLLDAVNWVPQSRPRIFVVGVQKHIDIKGFVSDKPNWAHSKQIINLADKVSDWCWWDLPEPLSENISLQSLIDFDHPLDNPEKSAKNIAMISESHMNKLKELEKEGRRVFPGYMRIRNGQQFLELRFDDIAGCLRAPTGGSSRQHLVISISGELHTRLLSISETAKLMGAPNGYKIPGSYNDGYRAMGDAVAMPAVKFLSENLLAPLANRVAKIKQI
ncbi:DNA (cytosine-5-)-methyltransferase [Veronia nyctiphanis]|uniref:DNA (cytosine-5-)-methyltransferase n=1 Tax=Veronia nyctiphanis TaxID=1278244 RepID=A0A4V1LS81_9GAMM|nr:DNA cytosine methyltransferase [Veronia nyctiphanis]RXJ70778.1 DNA (cytosine-5-)-methyltransferase [Veronia nyctiphanis]